MKRYLLIAAAMLIAAASAHAKVYYKGDVNRDNVVDVVDINAVINVILNGTYESKADVNEDGCVDVVDINAVVNYITTGELVEVRTGVDYVWNMNEIPEIHLYVSLDEWNRLLALYDSNEKTKQYIVADMDFSINGEHTAIEEVGLRLKGNTSRRRPEGSRGQMHQSGNTDWHHVHFGINMRKWVKDSLHDVKGVRKLHLKWFKDDPTYVRELFCYNLFRDFGVWTASRSNYCRLWLQVEGDSKETYYGIYEMIEPVDENNLKQRDDEQTYGTHKGNLWKCKYVNSPASLTDPYNKDYGPDDETDANHTYTLETNTSRFDAAKEQFIDFQLKLNGKSDDSFYTWIKQVCDVDLLLRTYAVTVAVGMWDDYWNNANNYYLYFTTEDISDYKVYMIPYDYDNTLGTSASCGVQSDSGRQDPLNWGSQDNRLIARIMAIPEFKNKYIAYLKELVDDNNNLMHYNDASARIRNWHQRISQYVSNDTGEDMVIEDRPASWGNHSEYRLLEDSQYNNFFRVKADVINNLR